MFFLLAGSGLVAPVPEEITLLTSGYFVALGYIDPIRAIPLAMLAILCGDSVLFFLAKTGSHYAHGVHARLQKYGLEKTWVFSPNHPLRAVFIMRFFTGLRMISPVFAGFNEATWAGFLLTDLAALCIYVPLLFALGFHFRATFLEFVGVFELVRHVLFWSMVAFVGGEVLTTMHPVVRRLVARVRRKRADTP
jgi:membrane protein DedA with SNARE-associated domain